MRDRDAARGIPNVRAGFLAFGLLLGMTIAPGLTELVAGGDRGPALQTLRSLHSLTAQQAPTAAALESSERESGENGAESWEPPRTVFGQPDLQGNWSNATLTPFQRPDGQDRVLTPEQVQRIERGQEEAEAETREASDPDRPPPPPGGTDPVCIDSSTSCYNEVYRDPGESVAVVDGEPRSSLVTDPPDGRVPELTAEGQRRLEAYRAARSQFGPYDHPEVRPLGERCIVSFGSSAGPPMLPNYWYNNNYTIVQTADHVLIMAEMVHDARIIRLGDPEPLPDDVRPWFGDSRGHWEGNTLVVETTNIHPDQLFRGVPPSAEMKVVERFTRVDENTIRYEFTIDDPATYTETWGGEVPFNRLDEALYEYACHEGNYALENVLSGARYQERQEEDGSTSGEGPE